MEVEALEHPAELSIWCTNRLDLPPALQRFASLREAITSAVLALDNSNVQPWIVTNDGEMLSPNWIKTYIN